MTTVLTAETRTQTGKASRALAADNKLPAVVYGPKQEAIAITVPALDFARVLREQGETAVLELSGVSASPIKVLIHDIDFDPVMSTPRHVDFYAIQKGAKVTVAIPLNFIGEAPAAKAGASIVKVLHEVEVEAAPESLPQEIEVDISTLENVGDQIHAGALKVPAGVTVNTDAEEVVVLAQEVKEEEESAAVDMSAIEVEQKGKGDEEESGE